MTEVEAARNALIKALSAGPNERLIALAVERMIKAHILEMLERQIREEARDLGYTGH